jgi:hypothetical protein
MLIFGKLNIFSNQEHIQTTRESNILLMYHRWNWPVSEKANFDVSFQVLGETLFIAETLVFHSKKI